LIFSWKDLLSTPVQLPRDLSLLGAALTIANAEEADGMDRSMIATRRIGESDEHLSEEPSWVVAVNDFHG